MAYGPSGGVLGVFQACSWCYRHQFEAGGNVSIINSKIHLREISFNAYFKAIFRLNSLSGSTAGRCMELKPLPVLIHRSYRSAGIGKDQ